MSKTYTEKELSNIASGLLQTFAAKFKKERKLTVGLVGDLGAGKTTLCKEILKQLNVSGPVVSPTFVLRKDYEGFLNDEELKIIHIDAYRLEKKEDIKQVLENEMKNQPKTLILVEWAELADLSYNLTLKIKHISETEREIEILSR